MDSMALTKPNAPKTMAERVRNNIEMCCAPPMTVSDFRTSCLIKIGEGEISYKKEFKTEEQCAEKMGLNIEVYRELAEGCDPKNLAVDDEEPFVNGDCLPSELPEKDSLAIHRFLKRGGVRAYRSMTRYVDYYKLDDDENNPEMEVEESGSTVDVEAPTYLDKTEVLLSVAVYHSRRHKDQEYLVVSKQYLTELRDVIVCQTDHAPTSDCSIDPEKQARTVKRANEVYKSGYFFIEGVFYNDMRDPKNVDYSKVVTDWAKRGERWKNPRLGVFSSRKMEETTFEDLKFRLGAPYLYSHQGDCEHLIIITDMRIIANYDPKCLTDYPALVCRTSKSRKKCSVCDLLTAKWMTRHDELAFEDPSFFCDSCFEYLHYDTKNKKLCEFEAYPYEKKLCK